MDKLVAKEKIETLEIGINRGMNQAGFALIDVLAAMLIVSLFAIIVAHSLSNNYQSLVNARQQMWAVMQASSKLAELEVGSERFERGALSTIPYVKTMEWRYSKYTLEVSWHDRGMEKVLKISGGITP